MAWVRERNGDGSVTYRRMESNDQKRVELQRQQPLEYIWFPIEILHKKEE